MTISLQVPDEVADLAARRGLDVAAFIEELLVKEVAAATPALPPSPRLSKEELKEILDGLAQFSDKIPHLPDSAFTRESIYSDHD